MADKHSDAHEKQHSEAPDERDSPEERAALAERGASDLTPAGPPPLPSPLPSPTAAPGRPVGGERQPWAEVLQAHAGWRSVTEGLPVDYRKDAVVVAPCAGAPARSMESIVRGVLPAAGWTVTFTSKVGGRFLANIA